MAGEFGKFIDEKRRGRGPDGGDILLKDIAKKFTIAHNTFNDFPEEDRNFLHSFSFICMLSFDVYLKKMIIENVIDSLNEENKENKEKK